MGLVLDLWRREVGVGVRGRVGFFILATVSAIAVTSALKVSVIQGYVMSLTELGSSCYLYVPFVQGVISFLSLYIAYLSDVYRSRRSVVADGVLIIILGIVLTSLSIRYGLSGYVLAASISVLLLGTYVGEVPALACIVDAYPPFRRVSVSSRVVYFMIFSSFLASMLFSALLLLLNWPVFSVISLTALIVGIIALLGITAVEEVRTERIRRSFSTYVSKLLRSKYGIKYLIFVFSAYSVLVVLALSTQYLIAEAYHSMYVPLGSKLPGSTYLDFMSLYILFNVTALVGAATFPQIYEFLGPNVTPPIALTLFFLPLTGVAFKVGLSTAYALAAIAGFGGGMTLSLAILYPSLVAEPEYAAGWFALYEVGSGASYLVAPTLLTILINYLHTYVLAVPTLTTVFGITALVAAVVTYSSE